jgi:integrase
MAEELVSEFRKNIKSGERPQSLKEKRAMAEETRMAEEKLAARARLHRITFQELADLYMAWSRENKDSAKCTEVHLRLHVLPVLGDLVATEITQDDIARLRDIIAAKHPRKGGGIKKDGSVNVDETRFLSVQTVLHILKAVREVFNYALDTDVPGSPGVKLFTGLNPVRISTRGRGIRLPHKDARRLRVLNEKERVALLAYEGVREEYADIRDMLLLSLDTGPRAGEICHLLRESVDPESGALRVIKGSKSDRSTKGGKTRIVYAGGLFPECLEMLRRRLAESSGSPYLFPGRNGGLRDSNVLNRIMRRIAGKLKFNSGVADAQNKVVWHTLRHTYATMMLEDGCDIYMLKELLGHRDLETTEGYLHLCDKAKREAALARKSVERQKAKNNSFRKMADKST